MIWEIFRKIYIRGDNDAEFGKFGGYLCMFKSMRWRGSHRAYPGGGGPDPRLSGHFVAKRYKIRRFWQIGNMQTTDDTGWAGVDGQTHT